MPICRDLNKDNFDLKHNTNKVTMSNNSIVRHVLNRIIY